MTLQSILILLTLTLLGGGTDARSVDFSPSHLVKGQYTQIEDIRAVIFNGIDGLNLYNQLVSGKGCINAIDLYVTDIEMMLDAFIGAIGFDRKNRQLYEFGAFNFTNSLGRFSPILRQCYKIGGEIDRNWGYFWNQTAEFTTLYNMIKANVIRNFTDIDARSSSLYDAMQYVDWP